MPVPIPIEDITIGEIDNQLGNPYGGIDISLEASYASTTSAIGLGSSGYAGNFHNLAMGVSSQDRFAQQIWGFWSGGSDLPVGNWGNYFYDANVVLDWDISMTTFKPGDLVSIDLYISDTNNGAGTNTFITSISLGANQDSVVTDFDTGIPAYTTYGANTGYWIYADMSSNITASDCYVKIPIGTYGDTDGVGPDTSRSRNGTTIPANIGMSNTFSGVIFGGTAIGAPIAWNKRTYFALTITTS